MYGFHSRLGRTVKGQDHQEKSPGLPERHDCPWLHGVCALGIVAHLPGGKWRLKERNLLCCYFSIIYQNDWEHRLDDKRQKIIKSICIQFWNVLLYLHLSRGCAYLVIPFIEHRSPFCYNQALLELFPCSLQLLASLCLSLSCLFLFCLPVSLVLL